VAANTPAPKPATRGSWRTRCLSGFPRHHPKEIKLPGILADVMKKPVRRVVEYYHANENYQDGKAIANSIGQEQSTTKSENLPRSAGIDAVGGDTLSNVIKQLEPQGSVAVCGLVASPEFAVNVFPFILRGVNVLGVDSVELPLADKTRNWVKLAEEWHLSNLDELASEINLGDLDGALASIYAGGVVGRTLVNVQTV
jgi:NADPH:quinone reductase-like Zn-dependent oxidoreductase